MKTTKNRSSAAVAKRQKKRKRYRRARFSHSVVRAKNVRVMKTRSPLARAPVCIHAAARRFLEATKKRIPRGGFSLRGLLPLTITPCPLQRAARIRRQYPRAHLTKPTKIRDRFN